MATISGVATSSIASSPLVKIFITFFPPFGLIQRLTNNTTIPVS